MGTFPPWKKGEKREKRSNPVQFRGKHHVLPQERRDSMGLAEP